MTVTMDPVDQARPSGGPGWGIAADLTPPEVVDRRRLKGLRRLVAAGLAAVVLLCVGAFAASVLHTRSAEDSLAETQERTSALTREQSKFREVVKVQADTRAIDAQIAELMKTDVDVASFLARLRSTLPGTMSLTSANVSLSTVADPAAAPADGTTSTPSTTGEPAPVGTVTLAGTSQRLSDLATYVANLQGMEGVVNVLPATNAAGESGAGGGRTAASWTVTLQLTDALYSHRYDLQTAKDADQ